MDNKAEITSLEGFIRLAIDNAMLNTHTSLPCIVDTVNDDGTVNATPAIKRIKTDNTEYVLPVIPSIPVLYPGNERYRITFPIQKGDEGYLMFSERDIGNFLSDGVVSKPLVLRKHDLSDAVFIPTAISDVRRPNSTPADGLKLEDVLGNASIQLQGGSVNITGTLTINGVPYLLHTHSGVQTGGGVSGPVVP